MDLSSWWLAAAAVPLAAGVAYRFRVRRRDVQGAPNLVGCAMDRLGITPADAEAAGMEGALLQARERCANCTVRAECRAGLAALLPRPLPSACVNAALFERIAREREGRVTR